MSATHCPNFNFILLCTFPDQWYIKATVMLVLGALFGAVTFVTKKVTVLMNFGVAELAARECSRMPHAISQNPQHRHPSVCPQVRKVYMLQLGHTIPNPGPNLSPLSRGSQTLNVRLDSPSMSAENP